MASQILSFWHKGSGFSTLDNMKQMHMALLIFHSRGDCGEQTGAGLITLTLQKA